MKKLSRDAAYDLVASRTNAAEWEPRWMRLCLALKTRLFAEAITRCVRRADGAEAHQVLMQQMAAFEQELSEAAAWLGREDDGESMH